MSTEGTIINTVIFQYGSGSDQDLTILYNSLSDDLSTGVQKNWQKWSSAPTPNGSGDIVVESPGEAKFVFANDQPATGTFRWRLKNGTKDLAFVTTTVTETGEITNFGVSATYSGAPTMQVTQVEDYYSVEIGPILASS